MAMRFTLKLTILGLAGYGAYALWDKYGARLSTSAGASALSLIHI